MSFRFHPARAAAWAMLVLGASANSSAQTFGVGSRGDGVLLSSFGVMTALALGPRHVFAATPAGIVSYDFALDRWELPLTEADGYPTRERPSALAYDRSAGVLWLGTAEGSLYSLTPGIDRWDRVTTTGIVAVLEIIPYAGDGALYLATQSGWLLLRTGSFIAMPVAPAAVPEAVRLAARDDRNSRDPFLSAARGTLGLDPALRRWRFGDIERGERPGEYWIGTLGGGLLRHDTRFSRTDWLPFGLVSDGAGAIAIDGDHIWFGGDGRGPRNGVARSDRELQRWTQFDAADGAPAGAVVDILVLEDAVWFAANDGLYRFEREGTDRTGRRDGWRRFTASGGLPSDAVTALTAAAGAVWVGTSRGLVRIQENGADPTPVLMPGVRINGLAARHDTLWVASDEGLRVVPTAGTSAGDPGVVASPAPSSAPVLRSRVVDVKVTGDAVYVATEDGHLQFAGGDWSDHRSGGAQARIGRIRRMAVDQGSLWLGGERGVAKLDLEGGLWTYFLAGQELPPGPVRAIVPAGEYVWVPTPAGAFRLRWRR